MSNPYSGSTSAGSSGSTAGVPSTGPAYPPPASAYPPPGQAYPPDQGNYAVGADYPQGQPSGAHSGDLGTPMAASGHPDVEGVSVGALMGELSKDLSTLMRQELALAKAEMTVEAKKAAQGAGMFGAAGFAGYMVALFLSLAIMWAFGAAINVAWGGLIVAILWGAVAAVTFMRGRKEFQRVHPKPERTVDTLQQVPGALKPH